MTRQTVYRMVTGMTAAGLLLYATAVMAAGTPAQHTKTKEKPMTANTEPVELAVGMKAPDFTLPATDTGKVTLSDLKGKWVVLYFYPKDDTPGCTTEACGMRDANDEIRAMGAVVLGVSKDSMASHEKFRDKYDLNFPLLSDTDKKVMDAYGVIREKKMYGKVSMGVVRSTFIIDDKGVIRKIWRNVKAKEHKENVLAALKELMNG